MELNTFIFIALALIFGLIASKIVDRLKLPHVTGYLVIGLIAGPSFLNIIPIDVIGEFSIITDLALGFIAFSIGSEFKLNYLKKVGKSSIVIAISEALGATILVTTVLVLFGYDFSFALLLGAIASATAPAATLMIIKQYKARGPVTTTLLPVVAIDDAIAIIVFGIATAIAKILQSPGSVSLLVSLKDPMIEIFGGIAFGALLGVILTLSLRWFNGKGNYLSITIAMIVLCVGVSNSLGFSSLLACMTMSTIYVNISETNKETFELVDTITPPLFMMFFFFSGAALDISLIPTVGLVGIIYVIARVIGKVGGAGLGAHVSNAPSVVKKYLGFNLIPQAGVAIGLSSMAMNVLPTYGNEIRTVVLFATIVYELIGPVSTKLALTKAGEIQPKIKEQRIQEKIV